MNIIVLQQKRGDDCKNNGRSKYNNDIFRASDHEGTEKLKSIRKWKQLSYEAEVNSGRALNS